MFTNPLCTLCVQATTAHTAYSRSPNAQIALFVQSVDCSPNADSMVSASTSFIHCIHYSQSTTMKSLTHTYMYLKTCLEKPYDINVCVLSISVVLHYQSHHFHSPAYIHLSIIATASLNVRICFLQFIIHQSIQIHSAIYVTYRNAKKGIIRKIFERMSRHCCGASC